MSKPTPKSPSDSRKLQAPGGGGGGGPKVGMPKRKTVAGPTTLSAHTSPGALRKSLVPGAGVNPGMMDAGSDGSGSTEYHSEATPTFMGNIKIASTIDVHKKLMCCKYNEEYDYLAVGDADGKLILYQSETDEFVLNMVDEEVARSPLTSIKHRPVSKNWPINNVYICTYTNGYVKGWNYNFRQVLYTIKENRSTLGLVYHSQWPKFVTYGDDAKIFLYDEESRVQERVLTSSKKPNTQDGHTSKVSAACFHPRNMYELVTAGIDRTIYFWDVRQPHATRHIPGVYMMGEGLDINTRGTQILACSLQRENSLQIFDYSNAKLIGKMDATDKIGQLHTGKFASKSYAVLGGNEPNAVHVIDHTTFESVAHVAGLPSTVHSIDVGPKKELDPKKMPTEFSSLPCCAAVSGNKLYQIDFY